MIVANPVRIRPDFVPINLNGIMLGKRAKETAEYKKNDAVTPDGETWLNAPKRTAHHKINANKLINANPIVASKHGFQEISNTQVNVLRPLFFSHLQIRHDHRINDC